MPIQTTEHRHFKALTNELNVNPNNRFGKNNIEWIEDLSYHGTGTRAYFLKIPNAIVNRPPGCKKMYFMKYFPGPNGEYITYINAGIFYTNIYPRYAHVEYQLMKKNATLIPWKDLSEDKKQHFVKIWGEQILDNLLDTERWHTAIKGRKTLPNDSIISRPDTKLPSIQEECLKEYLLPNSRETFPISCDPTIIDDVLKTITFKYPQVYLIENEQPTPDQLDRQPISTDNI